MMCIENEDIYTMEEWKLMPLPIQEDIETRRILKHLPKAHSALAELKGLARTIPNQEILLNTLILREAKDSSEIENIITSHDEMYKTQLNLRGFSSRAAKEVQNYASALREGYEIVKASGLITNNTIKVIQSILEQNEAGFRKQAGTVLKNDLTDEVIYTPPQHPDEIISLMSNLEEYINNYDDYDIDPLTQMAIIHFQFESIHPFYDGNGRTGRIINILYLILRGLQDLPILYLSQFIIRNKKDYYRLLQEVRTDQNWEEWILYMIRGVEEIALETQLKIWKVKELMLEYKHQLREQYKFYSQELLNNLFSHPYTKIELVMNDLRVSRLTAANYLNTLANDGMLRKHKIGRTNFYVNEELFRLLSLD